MSEKVYEKGELVGKISCPFCGAENSVVANKNRKLFFDCQECGIIYPNRVGGQKRLIEKMRPLESAVKPPEEKKGGTDLPPPARIAEPAPAAAVKNDPPPPKPHKSSILDMLP